MDQEKLDPRDALLFERVYVPAFVKRCAANGVTIPDEPRLKTALETTALVLHHMQDKQGNVIEEASASIKEALGVKEKEAALNEQNERLSTAFKLGEDKEVREAILSAVSQKSA
jgi:hypothetical protein